MSELTTITMDGMTELKTAYTDEELIRRVWDIEDIKDLTSRRMFYAANNMRREELNELWVQEPAHRATASFGRNWGYFIGMDHIARYYVVGHEKRRQEKLDAICKKHPEIENTPENLGLGCMELSPLTTPQLELAEDGKTARCIWFNTGMITELNDDLEPDSNWAFEHMGIDYVKEGDDWKIWHLYSSLEYFAESAENISERPVEPALKYSPFEEEFVNPDIAFLTHNVRYNWWDAYPAEPKPYVTFNPRESYAPEGHPALQSAEAMEKWKRGTHKW